MCETRKRFYHRNAAAKFKEQQNIREAMRLKLAGLGPELIADKLGCSRTSVWRYIKKGLASTTAEIREDSSQLRRLENMRLDRLQAHWWPNAVGGMVNGQIVEPDIRAANIVLRIIVDRCRLNGLFDDGIGPASLASIPAEKTQTSARKFMETITARTAPLPSIT